MSDDEDYRSSEDEEYVPTGESSIRTINNGPCQNVSSSSTSFTMIKELEVL